MTRIELPWTSLNLTGTGRRQRVDRWRELEVRQEGAGLPAGDVHTDCGRRPDGPRVTHRVEGLADSQVRITQDTKVVGRRKTLR